MALITDPDDLNDSAIDDASTEVFINTTTLRIKLNPGVGNLIAADGALEKAVYSFIKEEWKNDPLGKNLAAFPFPMVPITDEFFQLIEGWDWEDAATEQSIRRGGWAVLNSSGNTIKHFAGIGILDAEADDQAYFDTGAGATNFTFPGNTAEAVQVIDDPNGDGNFVDGFDRSGNITVYNREQAQLFSTSSTVANGEASLLAPKLFGLSLATGADLNIAVADIGIDATADGVADVAPYSGMSITRFSTPQSRLIGATSRDFGWIIDGNNGTKQQIYEFVEWSLRQTNDQDAGAGTLLGNVMPQLVEFVGPDLKTISATNAEGGGDGVYIDNFSAVDTNNLSFQDNLDVERTFPFVAAGSILFNTNLVNDVAAEYFIYFTDGVTAGLEWGNSGAILVDNNAGADLTGLVTGAGTIPFDFDYDGNNQGTRTPGTDANITCVAIGLTTGQYVRTTTTITRSNANSINFVSSIERQYENAA